MKWAFAALGLLAAAGCHRVPSRGPAASAFGAAIVDVGGEKQTAGVDAALDQPVVAQVNDAQGNAVAGALVQFSAPDGVRFDPPSGLTGSDGQLSTKVRLGGVSGRYSLAATTRDKEWETASGDIPRNCSRLSADSRTGIEREILLAMPQPRIQRRKSIESR